MGSLAEMLAKLVDVLGVGVDGGVGEIANLHVIDHASNEGIHPSLMWDHGTNFLGLKSGGNIQDERSQHDSDNILNRSENQSRPE